MGWTPSPAVAGPQRAGSTRPGLAIGDNAAPNAPTGLFSDGKDCATGSARPYVRTLTPVLAAKQSDPDTGQQSLTTWFHYWALGESRDDAEVLSSSAGNGTSVSRAIPEGKLAHGGTYAWQARTDDGSLTGPWSEACEFTIDVVAPPAPASVTSADYPPATPSSGAKGGIGVVGKFTFTPPANGVDDMTGYAWTTDNGLPPYSANQVTTTGAEPVTIRYAPTRDGLETMWVWIRDRAGWYSNAPFAYTFRVRSEPGPATEWRFDEASGAATDTTGHGNTLALGGGAARTPGRSNVGSALSLDGTSASAVLTGPVMAPDPDTGAPAAMRTDGSLTVSARVRLAATGGSGEQTVVAANGSRTAAYALSYSGSDDRWRFTIAGSDGDDAALYSVMSDAAPTAGKWTHLAAVFNASTGQLVLYVNGVAQAVTATLAGGFNATASVTVGKRVRGGVDGDFFNGAVDDLRFSSYAVRASNFEPLAAPLPPRISLPGGDTVRVGTAATAVIDALGDTNVVRYRYSIGSDRLDQTAIPAEAGGPVSIPLPTSTAGVVKVYAMAVDDGGRQSLEAGRAALLVKSMPALSGWVMDGEATMLTGAVVTLEPAGLTTVAAADGSYRFDGIEAGVYTVRATYGEPCSLSTVVTDVYVDEKSVLDLMLFPVTEDPGSTCT